MITMIHDTRKLSRNFKLIMTDIGISTFSTSIFTVLILWIAIVYTGSVVVTGFTSAFLILPLLFSFIIGAVIDRTPRKKLYAVTSPIMKSLAALFLIPVLFIHSVSEEIILLFLSAIIFGISKDILVPIRAIWAQRFMKRQVYLKGMSVASIVSRTAGLSGFIVSAAIVLYDIRLAIVIIVILYLLSILPILLITDVREIREQTEKFSKVLKDGFSYIRSNVIILSIVAVSAVSSLFLGMTDSASTVMTDQVFRLNSSYLSFALLSISSGGIVGSSLISRMKEINMVGRKLVAIYALSGAAFIFLGVFVNIYIFIAIFFFVGLFSGMSSPIISSVLFGNVMRERIGTVQGAMDTLGTSFNSASGMIAGIIMAVTFPPYVFFVMAGGLLAVSVLITRFKSLSTVRI